jgi:hypothetical protein
VKCRLPHHLGSDTPVGTAERVIRISSSRPNYEWCDDLGRRQRHRARKPRHGDDQHRDEETPPHILSCGGQAARVAPCFTVRVEGTASRDRRPRLLNRSVVIREVVPDTSSALGRPGPSQRHSRVEVPRFPGYAPELNPDECVWTQAERELANIDHDGLVPLTLHNCAIPSAHRPVASPASLVLPRLRFAVAVTRILGLSCSGPPRR